MKKVNGFAPLIENVHIVDFSPIGDKYIKVYANVMGIERSHEVEKVDEWAWRDAYEEDRDKVAQVIAQKMFKVDLTYRDFILRAVDAKLAQCDKLDINRFFSDFADMNLLNPYFGYLDNGFNSRGIHNVWARDTAGYINVHSLPRGYGGGVKDFKGKEMTANSCMASGACLTTNAGRGSGSSMRQRTTMILKNTGRSSRHGPRPASNRYSISMPYSSRQADGRTTRGV